MANQVWARLGHCRFPASLIDVLIVSPSPAVPSTLCRFPLVVLQQAAQSLPTPHLSLFSTGSCGINQHEDGLAESEYPQRKVLNRPTGDRCTPSSSTTVLNSSSRRKLNSGVPITQSNMMVGSSDDVEWCRVGKQIPLCAALGFFHPCCR